MPRLVAVGPLEYIALWLAAFGTTIGWAFGVYNIGFLYILTFALLMEWGAIVARAVLLPDVLHSARDMIRHWTERFLLVLLVPVGSSVDWLIYYMQPPNRPLGEVMHMNMTKVAFIGVIAFILIRVVKIIAEFHKDAPIVDVVMAALDRFKTGGNHPGRRDYDETTARGEVRREEERRGHG